MSSSEINEPSFEGTESADLIHQVHIEPFNEISYQTLHLSSSRVFQCFPIWGASSVVPNASTARTRAKGANEIENKKLGPLFLQRRGCHCEMLTKRTPGIASGSSLAKQPRATSIGPSFAFVRRNISREIAPQTSRWRCLISVRGVGQPLHPPPPFRFRLQQIPLQVRRGRL